MRNKIIELIYSSIDELNAQNEADSQLTKTEDTVIFGKDSNIDSLGLVNLIVSLEQAVNDEFNTEISLADERAMSQENSPFSTVSTLADYIEELLKQ
ncbi:MAG: acyl carrier protein [Bacteroidetes bacterium]|jgi:acyl carrier protein|nr:acyl carrier protein [Bacteroidota bacterium]